MKTLGIIGGIAPESTIAYYRLLVALYREQRPDGSYPPLLINSIDMTRMLDLIGSHQIAAVTDYLFGELQRLVRAGADFALMASNTPHLVYEDLRRLSPIPLVSIVETACRAAQALGLTKVGLIGTRFTMGGQFYPEVFSKQGITLVVPEPDDQAYIHEIYMSELINGIYLPETRAGLLAVADRMKKSTHIEGLILGGTELPLLLREPGDLGIPLLDTTRIHATEAVTRMLS